jgi:DMSO/TMAO reductase YedYZ molybdopterin-dependent catalytic subunit
MLTRRHLLQTAAASGLTGLGLLLPRAGRAETALLKLPMELPEGTRKEAVLDALPGKKPLIKLTYRPPNYETPVEYLRTAITPNDAFFVRYHLPHIPEVRPETWKLAVGGEGANGQVELTLSELRSMPAMDVVAVCQCSGNRRGLFQPHVPGVEWGYGAMGCARWKGVRLKDILDKVSVKKEAVEIVLNGADGPSIDKTPDFVKSIPVTMAMNENTLLAYEMNGEPLPHWNGFPARIVIPGWTGTYWVKHVTSIMAVTKSFDGFWMKSAYRIPLGKFPIVARFTSQETAANTPITEMVINSLITSHSDGAKVKAGSQVPIAGLAWDGGYGIRTVEVSTDDGDTWSPAALGPDLGRFAFRPWSYELSAKPGANKIMARAINVIGQTQTTSLILNPAGYHHNLIQSLTLVGA